MWIRTQDRNELIEVSNVKIEKTRSGDMRKCNIVCSSYDLQSTSYVIATYANKERCFEVLDEIQQAMIGKLMIPFNGQEIHHLPTVYQMPKEV